MSLTRSPSATYLWMAISLGFVIFLFARWDLLTAAGRQWQWWLVLTLFLAADFLFLLIPIRDRDSLRYLSGAGKLWACGAWLLVVVFLVTIVPQSATDLRKRHPLAVASVALLLLVILVVAIARLSRSWLRQSLRTIVARRGGGFLVTFPRLPENGEARPENTGAPLAVASESAQILLALRAIPGAEEESAGQWRVPAQAAAAAALLEVAKRFDFDFVPQPGSRQGS